MGADTARASERVDLGVGLLCEEMAHWQCHVTVKKFEEELVQWVRDKCGVFNPDDVLLEKYGSPYEVVEGPVPGNRLVTVGLNQLTLRLTTAAQVWDQTHSGLCVGDSSTADAIGDADLAGASKWFEDNDAAFPTQANGVLTFKSSFGSADGNFAWNEYGTIVGNTATVITPAATKPASYILLNRKAPAALGTKTTGVWTLTETITIV